MSELSAGRAVVELLKAEQVRYIFGIVGSTFLDVLDALYDDRSVEYINVRHEQAAAFMADGLARVTDVPGVCLVTSGPGATNLLTGVAAAYVAHSPVVVLVGGVAQDHYQKDAFQDFDLISMFHPTTTPAELGATIVQRYVASYRHRAEEATQSAMDLGNSTTWSRRSMSLRGASWLASRVRL
jgi:thiamine pyrophosphate-dependent acetolactate synthase large subunit-like protein